ncbi:MAG: glycogen debranching protein [Rubrobacteraceae bacterium]
MALAFSVAPATAQSDTDAYGAPTLSTEDRLEDRRYVAVGDRAYVAGMQDGSFPAMGFHTRGEMGGIWTPQIKLLDGVWFGVNDEWLTAERFTSGYGYTQMEMPEKDGLEITRTDFAPDGSQSVLIGLSFSSEEERSFTLNVDARSELMSSYPWGETNPSQLDYNLQDEASVENGRLVFREQGTPDAENASEHDWAAVVGSSLEPSNAETGENFRGPRGEDPTICPPSPDEAPDRCDDTEYGKGAGARLAYEVTVPAGETQTVWLAIAGSDKGLEEANAEFEAAISDPEGALQEKVSNRLALQQQTVLDLPGDRQLQESIDWSKQNLADAVQVVDDLQIRETNAGENYPAPEGMLEGARFLGAGWPDYPWLFGTDGEYTVFASVAAGQFEPIKDHLRALRDVSLIDNGDSGKVVHEVVYDGSVYFGSNADDGNTDETAKFPSAVAVVWRWTGDAAWLEEMYPFSKSNMEYIFRELDEDSDLWPEGLGNVEREGMGEEKLDNTVYTIRGLYDLADMAEYLGDVETADWATERADEMLARFDDEWWMEDVPQHADSLGEDGPLQQRHWIGATPMEVELKKDGEPVLGLTTEERANAALDLRQTECFGDEFGMFHTGRPGCDEAGDSPSEEQAFTLNTSIIAVAEGNYGRLAEQEKWTSANARLQLPNPDNASGEPDEMPGAMPEIAPSPMNGRTIDRPLNERPMVHQAWGAYGTLWPVVHQHLGVRPDLGRDTLEVTPQVPPDSPTLSGANILMGDGSLAVSASASEGVYTTTVTPNLTADLTLGHTLPKDAEVASTTLDGQPIPYETRDTNRGLEVLVEAGQSAGERTLIITTPGANVPDTGGLPVAMPLGAAFILAGVILVLLFNIRRSGGVVR